MGKQARLRAAKEARGAASYQKATAVIRSLIASETKKHLLKGKHDPKPFQLDAAVHVAERKDTILIAPTGAGKTLVLAMPLLFHKSKISLVISPLHALESDQVAKMNALGVPSLLIDSTTIEDSTYKAILRGDYRLIFTSPELLEENKKLLKLFEERAFRKKLHAVNIDEAHIISQWGEDFRQAYARLGTLRALCPPGTPFFATSATLPPYILQDVIQLIGYTESVKIIQLSNDRPNLYLSVRAMDHPKKNLANLDFLVPEDTPSTDKLTRTIIYSESRNETAEHAEHLRKRLSYKYDEDHPPIAHFHAEMSEEYKTKTLADFISGKTAILCATEAAGMGCDIPNVERVVQYGLPKTLCTFMQRSGRGQRDPTLLGEAILLVEKEHLKPKPDEAAGAANVPPDEGRPGQAGRNDAPVSGGAEIDQQMLDGERVDADSEDELWATVGDIPILEPIPRVEQSEGADHRPSGSTSAHPQPAPTNGSQSKPIPVANITSQPHPASSQSHAFDSKQRIQANKEHSKEEMIQYVLLTSCRRIFLNIYFHNPTSPNDRKPDPYYCCDNCRAQVRLRLGIQPENVDEALAPAAAGGRSRGPKKYSCPELAIVLPLWREKQADLLNVASDDFVLSDKCMTALLGRADTVDSLEKLQEITGNQVPLSCRRELLELIITTVEAFAETKEAEKAVKAVGAAERKKAKEKERREANKQRLESARETKSRIEAIPVERRTEEEAQELTVAMELVDKAEMQRKRRNSQAAESRRRKKARVADDIAEQLADMEGDEEAEEQDVIDGELEVDTEGRRDRTPDEDRARLADLEAVLGVRLVSKPYRPYDPMSQWM